MREWKNQWKSIMFVNYFVFKWYKSFSSPVVQGADWCQRSVGIHETIHIETYIHLCCINSIWWGKFVLHFSIVFYKGASILVLGIKINKEPRSVCDPHISRTKVKRKRRSLSSLVSITQAKSFLINFMSAHFITLTSIYIILVIYKMPLN